MIVQEILLRYRRPLIGLTVAMAIYALAGFFAAPWLIERMATNAVRDEYGATLEMQNVALNPFVLSLRIDGLELDAPDDSAVVQFDQLFVNFQTSSLFRWAWTFREFHLDGLEIFLRRENDGQFNVAFLAGQSAPPTEPANAEASGSARLLVHDFAIRESVVHWNDDVPPEAVDTAFGPVNVAIAELNTLPDRAGLQDVVITTESQGTLSWNGSLQLNPLFSEGSASIRGSHFPLTSAYLKHEVGFDVVDGLADVDLDYRVATRPDQSVEVAVTNFNLAFNDVLVRTFNAAVGREGEDREVLRLSRIGLSGGEMHWPDRTASAVLFSIDSSDVNLFRDPAGALNIVPAAEPSASEAPDNAPNTDAGEPWQLSLDQFNISRLALNLLDESVTPAADIGWQSLDVEIRDINNASGTSFTTTMQLVARDGGTIAGDGSITVLPAPVVDFNLSIDALELASTHPYLKPLADVNLDSGVLNLAAELKSSAENPLRVAGDLEIADFLITETDEGSRLGSWRSLVAENLIYSVSDNALDVSEVRLVEPYGDILIAEDGSINLGRVQKTDQATTQDAIVEDDAVEPRAAPVTVTIGRVSIENMAADFVDLSLPLPFNAQIADMNGELSTISTASAEPSTVLLEGKVDEFGQVRIDGSITPLDPPANTDINVQFENVEMPKFSAYSIPFAGREIASGRLDLDLGYKLDNRRLAGDNNIVLRDFELGDEVDHPGAMSLPLGLAVALLKDPEGKIDIDLPVEGDLDDPEFRIGGVVMQALGNLITRIVTAPFALLANLVGAEADELEFLVFTPGRSDLSPPEVEKTVKISEALAMRPELALEIRGVFTEDDDGGALRMQKFDAVVEARIEALGNDTMYADNRMRVIETLFAESGIAEDPDASLAAARAEHTTPEPESPGDAAPGFDALAYTESLRRQLIDAQPLSESELVALARERADSVRQAIVSAAPELVDRVFVDTSVESVALDDDTVPMRVRLTTGRDLEAQETDVKSTTDETADIGP
jgi:hypothetical protein